MLCGHQTPHLYKRSFSPDTSRGCSPAAGPGSVCKGEGSRWMALNIEKSSQSWSASEQRGNAPRQRVNTTQRQNKTLFLLDFCAHRYLYLFKRKWQSNKMYPWNQAGIQGAAPLDLIWTGPFSSDRQFYVLWVTAWHPIRPHYCIFR